MKCALLDCSNVSVSSAISFYAVFPTAVYASARVHMYVINYEYLVFLLQEIRRDIGGIKWNVICMG